MSRRTAQANKAIAAAWSNEQQLVREGKGTRDWTPEQQRDILDRGKAYDDNGKAFEGHHMKSTEMFPEYQGDCENIQFLTRSEHFLAHNRNFQNPTNGFFNPHTGETKDFGSNKYVPCEIIKLSEPVYIKNKAENVDSNKEKSKDTIKKDDVVTSGIKTKRDVSAKMKIIVSKSQKIGEKMAAGTGKIAKFAIENKEVIGITIGAVGGIIRVVKSAGEASRSDYSLSTDEDDEGITYEEENPGEEDFEEDDISDESLSEGSEKSSRASPRQHPVVGYPRRRNGKVEYVKPCIRPKDPKI